MADRSDEDFSSRWSRRKRAARAGTVVAEEPGPDPRREPALMSPATAGAVAGPSDEEPDRQESEGDPEVIAKLPDIESLDDSSDFTVFLQNGVPEALRRRALRKLWRVNPVLANLDGLNNYDEDYSMLGKVDMPGLKSIFQVGRGMVLEEEPAVPDTEVEPGAEPGVEPGVESGAATPARADQPESDAPGTDEPSDPARETAAISATAVPAPQENAQPEPSLSKLELPGPDTTKLAGSRVVPRAAPKRAAAERRWGRFRT